MIHRNYSRQRSQQHPGRGIKYVVGHSITEPFASRRRRFYFLKWVVSLFCLLVIIPLVLPKAAVSEQLGINDFKKSSLQGFADKQNSVMWSMKWWDKTGKLYVGTNRAWLCWSYAGTVATYPPLAYLYPPQDPDVECTEDYNDLPLQAQIWAWDPETDGWELVYESPMDVPIPGTDKFVARDIAFRSAEIFIEDDGTEAMYFVATNSKPIHKTVPPPRILRTTDGINFEPIPQESGTMANLPKASFRSLTSYKNRLFVIHGSVQGNGKLYESATPYAGNDTWQQVSPDDPDLRFFELQVYNGYLYAGSLDLNGGYAVLRTDAEGEPPYEFTPVVLKGGYLLQPSKTVVSMHEYNGYLYVGTDAPAELIRIGPDDQWDLIAGTPRVTPAGYKIPLSGLAEGFGFGLNEHLWRMQSHENVLYIGTYDASTSQRTCPGKAAVLDNRMGFDLYKSSDGIHFSAITINGFGDPFDFGIRTFQSTPYGLFVGTANYYYGANIYRGVDEGNSTLIDPPGEARGLNLSDQGVLVAWTPPENATIFRVYRSEFTKIKLNIPGGILPDWLDPYDGCYGDISLDSLPQILKNVLTTIQLGQQIQISTVMSADRRGQSVPMPGEEIGTTDLNYFIDTTVEPEVKYSYYVVAEDAGGNQSESSNLVTFPGISISAAEFNPSGKSQYNRFSDFSKPNGQMFLNQRFYAESKFQYERGE